MNVDLLIKAAKLRGFDPISSNDLALEAANAAIYHGEYFGFCGTLFSERVITTLFSSLRGEQDQELSCYTPSERVVFNNNLLQDAPIGSILVFSQYNAFFFLQEVFIKGGCGWSLVREEYKPLSGSADEPKLWSAQADLNKWRRKNKRR